MHLILVHIFQLKALGDKHIIATYSSSRVFSSKSVMEVAELILIVLQYYYRSILQKNRFMENNVVFINVSKSAPVFPDDSH